MTTCQKKKKKNFANGGEEKVLTWPPDFQWGKEQCFVMGKRVYPRMGVHQTEKEKKRGKKKKKRKKEKKKKKRKKKKKKKMAKMTTRVRRCVRDKKGQTARECKSKEESSRPKVGTEEGEWLGSPEEVQTAKLIKPY